MPAEHIITHTMQEYIPTTHPMRSRTHIYYSLYPRTSEAPSMLLVGK